MTLEIGATYKIKHTRKGTWEAKLLEVQGAGTNDEWYVLSDDPSSPVRASFCTMEKVTA